MKRYVILNHFYIIYLLIPSVIVLLGSLRDAIFRARIAYFKNVISLVDDVSCFVLDCQSTVDRFFLELALAVNSRLLWQIFPRCIIFGIFHARSDDNIWRSAAFPSPLFSLQLIRVCIPFFFTVPMCPFIKSLSQMKQKQYNFLHFLWRVTPTESWSDIAL